MHAAKIFETPTVRQTTAEEHRLLGYAFMLHHVLGDQEAARELLSKLGGWFSTPEFGEIFRSAGAVPAKAR